jgi:hypothetical protein
MSVNKIMFELSENEISEIAGGFYCYPYPFPITIRPNPALIPYIFR